MVFKETKESDNTEKWNTAKTYSALMIMKNLYLCDTYIITAKYGAEIQNESIVMDGGVKIISRIEALNRLIDTTKLIFKNTSKFLKKSDKKEFARLREMLKDIEKYLPAIKDSKVNMGTHEDILVINENHFNLCLEYVMKINEDLIEPLNNCGLIFKEVDELNIDEIKQQIISGG